MYQVVKEGAVSF